MFTFMIFIYIFLPTIQFQLGPYFSSKNFLILYAILLSVFSFSTANFAYFLYKIIYKTYDNASFFIVEFSGISIKVSEPVPWEAIYNLLKYLNIYIFWKFQFKIKIFKIK